jgi:hypothetical protein
VKTLLPDGAHPFFEGRHVEDGARQQEPGARLYLLPDIDNTELQRPQMRIGLGADEQ